MKIIFYIRTNTGCPVFLTACCYLVIGNPAVIIMRLKYNVHSLIYSKPIFEEKGNQKIKNILQRFEKVNILKQTIIYIFIH